jgi:hypothetical protein
MKISISREANMTVWTAGVEPNNPWQPPLGRLLFEIGLFAVHSPETKPRKVITRARSIYVPHCSQEAFFFIHDQSL